MLKARFSELATKSLPESRDWFDTILSTDTQLFVDPFLVYSQQSGFFEGAHQEVIDFFNAQFQKIARSKGDTNTTIYQQAQESLRLPEVQEVCLGYSGLGTKGAGSGTGTARVIAAAMWQAIRAGIEELSHFEEIALFSEGFGADRISDAVINILRHRFAKYTTKVCERLGVVVEEFHYVRGRYNIQLDMWEPLHVSLPLNPWAKQRLPILLVPRVYLRNLPAINSDSFWLYCYTHENKLLRQQFGKDITKRLDKKSIIDLARHNPGAVKNYVESVRKRKVRPYNLDKDPKGIVSWYPIAQTFAQRPRGRWSPRDCSKLVRAIETMVTDYKHFVEHQGGWAMLMDRRARPVQERIAQKSFHLSITTVCRDNNIDISPETNIGRGPVDFKLSRGSCKVLLEMKHVSNTKFWQGLETQLPIYLQSERVEDGFYIPLAYNPSQVNKVSAIRKRLAAINSKHKLRMKIVHVRVQRQLSASQAKSV